MDIQKEAVREYLVDGIPFRLLAKKLWRKPQYHQQMGIGSPGYS